MPYDADALRAENGRLRMLLEDKDAKIAELEERVARLERLISRNSGNSSMPPSTDDLPGRKPPERRARRGGGRKPGKQPGAPGAYLAWSQDPDTIIDHFPQGRCTCGADLSGAADLGVRYSHQVTDLPEARAETVQHDRHEVRCACGQVQVADAPAEAAGAPGTVTYGLNFQAWCVFLLVMHHIPVERCADIIESMSGTRPSDGWVHSLLERAAQAVAAANMAIRALILLARVICGDETPVRVGPGPKSRKKYLQVACTNLLTRKLDIAWAGGSTRRSLRSRVRITWRVSWLLSRWGGGWASGSGRVEGQAISGQPVRSGTRVYPSSLARFCRARTWRRVLARLS